MSSASYFTSGSNSTPVTVFLNAEVIRGINSAIALEARDQPGRGREIGGILLGNFEDDRPGHPAVRIEQFEPIPSEHRRGPSFVLTDHDKRVLSRRLVWSSRKRKDGLRPVGYYRSHTRRGLYIDNDDFSVFQAFFPEPYSVFLLVRPVIGAPGAAGFFFWEDGDMHRESSRMEFPFDPVRLPLITAPPPPPPAPKPAPLPAAKPAQPSAAAAIPGGVQSVAFGPILRKGAIPAAALSVFLLTFYAARTLTQSQSDVSSISQHAKVERPAPTVPNSAAPVVTPPATVPVTIEKPSPLAPKREDRRNAAAPTPATSAAPQQNPAAGPSGSASRSVPDTAPVMPVRPAPEPEAVTPPAASPTAPAATPPAIATLDIPARTEQLPRVAPAPVATVTVEPVGESRLGRVVGHIPGFRRFGRKNQGFVPARPIRQVAPTVTDARDLLHEVPVDLRITVDPEGNVSEVEPTHGGDKRLVRVASEAARGWQFEPARRNDETVSSELILHFTFRPVSSAAEP